MINNKKFGMIFLIVALVALGVIFVFMKKTGINTKKLSNISIAYDDGSKADFYTYNKKIYYLTKDGFQLISENGENVFSDTFTMTSPALYKDSAVVAVAEKDGRSVKVYNDKGRVSDITVSNPIAFANVNSQGDVCVVSKGDTYTLGVYNNQGEKNFEGSFASADGIPLCADISDDGRVLAVAFLDVSDIKVKSRVGFYSIMETDSKTAQESDSDFMFASFIEDDAVVGEVSFLQGNTFCSFSDQSLKMISLDPSGQGDRYKEILSYKLNNHITAIDLNNKKYVSLAFGNANLNSESPDKENSVKWFSSKGEVLGQYNAEKTIESLNSDYDTTIASMGRQFVAVNAKGNVIWAYTAIQDVKRMLFLSNNEDVLLVGNKEAYSVDVINGNKEIEAPKEKENKGEKNEEDKSSEASTSAINNDKAVEQTKEIVSEQTTEEKKAEKVEVTTKKKSNQKAEKATEKTTEVLSEKPTEKATEKTEQKLEENAGEKVEEPVEQNNSENEKVSEAKDKEENTDIGLQAPVMPE